MKLYKIYIPYREKRVVLHLCFAQNESEAVNMTGFNMNDKPRPVIKEIPIKEGSFMCHHIADSGLYGQLKRI